MTGAGHMTGAGEVTSGNATGGHMAGDGGTVGGHMAGDGGTASGHMAGGGGNGGGGDNRETLFTRDGHLTELSAARRALDELKGEALVLVEAHLDGCAMCRAREEQDRAFEAQLQLPELVLSDALIPNELLQSPQLPDASLPGEAPCAPNDSAVPSQDGSSASLHAANDSAQSDRDTPDRDAAAAVTPLRPAGSTVALGMILALAAGVMLWLSVRAPQAVELARLDIPSVDTTPGFRSKGGPVTLEVFVHDGARSRRAEPNEPVHPGDRLGFRISAPQGGQLLVAGIDARDEAYLCHPQAAGGASAPIAPGTQGLDLADAIELDTTPGRERIVAVLCPEPFELSALSQALQSHRAGSDAGPLPRLLPDCAQHDIVLVKEPVGDE